jgi:hypothetical protein
MPETSPLPVRLLARSLGPTALFDCPPSLTKSIKARTSGSGSAGAGLELSGILGLDGSELGAGTSGAADISARISAARRRMLFREHVLLRPFRSNQKLGSKSQNILIQFDRKTSSMRHGHRQKWTTD